MIGKRSSNAQTPENQLTQLREVAEKAGWVVVEEFVDHGISGAKGRDQRPAYDRLCKAATQRQVDVVMAWSVDRLGRSLQDRLVQVAAGLLIAYGIGASIGPIMAALSMAAFGPAGFFLFIVGVNSALILFTTIRIIQRRPGKKAKAPFMPLGGVGVSSKQLYTSAIISAERDKFDDS